MSERIHDLLDARAAEAPGAPALICGDRRWTRAGLRDASIDAAAWLAGAGVRPGDRVLLVAENCAEAVAWLFGASRAGAAAAPINARQTAAEVDRIAEAAAPAAVVLTTAVSADAAAHAERLGALPRGPVAVAARPGAPDPEREVAALMHTTGTTGGAKGVMLTHANLLFAGRASARVRGMGPGDEVLGALPMTHVFGLASMTMAAVAGGATLRLLARFSPDAVLAALETATIFPAVPQMHAAVMRRARERGLETAPGRPRYVSSGAAPLDPAWKRDAEAFYGAALQNGYGLTESTAGVATTSNRLGDPDASVGPPLDGVEVRIDAPGPDGVGEILTRGPHVMLGYRGRPEETAAVLRDGWLHTGDLGRIDGAGRLHVAGRAKELIIRGGFNVYPPEVEAALNDHPAVAQCAVVGRARGGDEEVLAFVTLTAEVSEAELSEWARARLAGYKRPARIVAVEVLPAAATGKILKHLLVEAFADRL